MSSSKRARTESYSPSLGSELLQFDNAHATSVLKTLYTQSKTGCGTDFTVWCGAERCRFDMHSAVIAATSAYFCTLIGGSWATRQAVLGQIAPRIFEQIAESLYTGRLRNVEEETAVPLLEASRYLQINHAEVQCRKWLLSHLSAYNCLGIWDTAGRFDCAELRAEAVSLAGRHLAVIGQTDAFLDLEQARLVLLLGDELLAVRDEKAVYTAVMAWVKHDSEGRRARCSRRSSIARAALPSTFGIS